MKMKYHLFAVLALFTTNVFAQLQLNLLAPLTPLYSSYNASVTDYLYTINPQHHAIALNTYGNTDTGVLAYMEKTQ
jgi:hypothetical protein